MTVPTAAPALASTIPLPPVRNGEKPLVLVVDDDPAVRDLMQRSLGQEGYLVHGLADSRETVAVARKVKPAAIALDVMMPGMDGWSVLGALKREADLADIPVVMMTMLENNEMSFALGAAELLSKPVNASRLARIIRRFDNQKATRPILVVEDDAPTRDMLRHVLEKEGWKIALAANGREGLAALDREKPALVLLDLMMPVMDGFEFLRNLREDGKWNDLPVVVLSGEGT